MVATGRLGGRGRTRSVLGISDAVADEGLRAQAKLALENALASDNEQVRLRAAQSLYSYRSQEAPRDAARTGPDHPGRGVFYIGDLVRRAIEMGVLEIEGEGEVRIGGIPVERGEYTPRKESGGGSERGLRSPPEILNSEAPGDPAA
jgi:hypothetical protein